MPLLHVILAVPQTISAWVSDREIFLSEFLLLIILCISSPEIMLATGNLQAYHTLSIMNWRRPIKRAVLQADTGSDVPVIYGCRIAADPRLGLKEKMVSAVRKDTPPGMDDYPKGALKVLLPVSPL